MKSKTFVLVGSLISLLLTSLFLVYSQDSQINRIKRSHTPLNPGEKITYLDIMDMNKETFDVSMLKPDRGYLFFIFKMPCSACNRNLSLWIQMARILDGGTEILGIIPTGYEEARRFVEDIKGKLNFNVYVPYDADKFRKEMRLGPRTAQTILYYNKVEYIKEGNLDGDDYTAILRKAKAMQSTGKKEDGNNETI